MPVANRASRGLDMIMGHTVVRVPSLSSVSARLHLVGLDLAWRWEARRGRSSATGGARHAAASTIGQSLGYTGQHGPPKCQNVSGTRSVVGYVRESYEPLKLLANYQTGGDSPAEVLV